MIGGLDVYVGNAIIYSGEEHEFVIVHGKEDRSEVLSRENSCVKEYKVDLYRKINLFNDFLCLLQVVKIIKREEPDVIHCHSAKGGVVGRIAGWITRKKTYYTPHAFSFLFTLLAQRGTSPILTSSSSVSRGKAHSRHTLPQIRLL